MADEIVALHQRLRAFFTLIFGDQDGYIAFATIDRDKKPSQTEYFQQSFHLYPDHLDEAFIDIVTGKGATHDIYFCAQLLVERNKRRVKENIRLVSSIWADLDDCPPTSLLLPPTITIETSPGRHQAFWRMDDPIPAAQGEEFARRIAYYHTEDGADKSGWDLGQLLRVPYTFNHKYENKPFIQIVNEYSAVNTWYFPPDFDAYPTTELPNIGKPDSDTVPSAERTGEQILFEDYAGRIDDLSITLFERTPNRELAGQLGYERADWSELLYALEMQLFEQELTPEEVFAVCRDAACNKFKRDTWRRNPDQDLWEDVQRAYSKHKVKQARERPDVKAGVEAAGIPPESGDAAPETPGEVVLLSAEEATRAARDFTFIDHYKGQLSNVTDAPPEFHTAAAFMLLSYFCARRVLMKLSYAPRGFRPLLWFMVLAPPATRKSTAYNHARDFLNSVDPNHPETSLTSPEGFLSELAHSDGFSLVYAVDEVQDNLLGRIRKDHMQEFFGTLSNSYDGKRIRKTLKNTEYDVLNPMVVSYCTGILKTTLERMSETEIFSKGLAQRFLYVVHDQPADLTTYRRMSAATEDHQEFLHGIEHELHAIQEKFLSSSTYDVIYEPFVNERMGETETLLIKEARDSASEYAESEWASTFKRLSEHIMRAAVLIACSRPHNPVDGAVLVSEDDMLKALWFGELWRRSARIILEAVGKPPYERQVDKALRVIADHGKYGCTRDKVYRELSLTNRDGIELLETLEQRGIVRVDYVKQAKKKSDWKPEFRANPDPKDRITLVEEAQ